MNEDFKNLVREIFREAESLLYPDKQDGAEYEDEVDYEGTIDDLYKEIEFQKERVEKYAALAEDRLRLAQHSEKELYELKGKYKEIIAENMELEAAVNATNQQVNNYYNTTVTSNNHAPVLRLISEYIGDVHPYIGDVLRQVAKDLDHG